MAGNNIHSQITDQAEIHVPKGFTEAPNYTGPVKNAAGALEWRDLDQLGRKNNYNATIDPIATDDANIGYATGSHWVNTVQRNTFTCVDATPGAAVWRVVIRNNPKAIVDPTVNDDASKGYVQGSVWINVADGRETWMCTDNLIGHAEWKSLTSPDIVGIDHRTLAYLESDDHLQYLNRSGVRPMTGDLDMGNQSVVNALQYNGVKLPEANIARVRKDPGDNEYGSIADAVAAITTASISNPWVVDVGAGEYTEPQIVMKPYVSIIGRGSIATSVIAQDPTNDLFIGAPHTQLSSMAITGVTTAGKAGVHFNGAGGLFLVSLCSIFNNDVNISVVSASPATALIVRDTEFSGTFNYCIRSIASFGLLSALFDNCTIEGMASDPSSIAFDIQGPTNTTVIRNATIRGNGTNTGIKIHDGSEIKVLSSSFRNNGTGIFADNVGAAPLIDAIGLTFSTNSEEIRIDHSGTTGSLSYHGDQTKYISTSNHLAVNLLDRVSGDLVFSGSLKILQSDQSIQDLSTLLIQGATMGIEQGGELLPDSGFQINLTAGFGHVEVEPGLIRRIDWGAQTIAFPPSSVRYIYFDGDGVLQQSPTSPVTQYNILLGRVVTNGTGVVIIDDVAMISEHTSNRFDKLLREAIGPVYKTGSTVTENGVRQLDISAGQYFVSSCEYTPVGGTALTWTSARGNGAGGYIIGSQNVVDNASYDDGSGNLVPLTAGYYAKHSLYTVGEGVNEKYFLIYSQTEYSALTLAQQGSIPTPPSFFVEGVTLIASIIVQEGFANIVQIRDERPRIGFTASGVAAATFHTNLLGLTVGDDHPQYWRNDGAHVASGSWDMGGNSISNIGTLNNVTIEDHSARHQPGGLDALSTAAAVTLTPDLANAEGSSTNFARADHVHNVPADTAITLDADSTNTEGTSSSFARADHTHDLTTGAASTQIPDQVNGEGTSAALARADHVHNIPVAVAIGMNANTTNQAGVAASFSRSDHQHFILSATPSTQTPDQTNTTGTAAGFARADHIHNIPTAVAIGMNANTANAQGTNASFSRSDHQHAIASGTAVAQAPDQANATGTSTNFARADHIHNIPTASAVGLSANTTNTQGAAATFTRADHTHAISTGAATSQSPDQVNSAGVSANLARADHIHNIPTAAAVGLNAASTNTQGVGTSFARNDHTHSIGTALVADITTIQPDATASAGTSNNFARGDHRHAIDAAAPSSNLGATSTNTEGVSTSFARADHTHAVTSSAASTQTPDQVNATGTSANFARADHVHNIPTDVAITITDSTNSQGAAATFSRADHGHAHGTRGGGTLHSQVTTSVDGFMTAADKVILNRLRSGFLQYTSSADQNNSTTTMQSIPFPNDRSSFPNSFFTKVNDTDFRADFTGRVEVDLGVVAYANANDRRCRIQIFLNGTAVTDAYKEESVRGNSAQGGSIHLTWIVPVAANDILTFRFASQDGAQITLPATFASVLVKIYTLGLT